MIGPCILIFEEHGGYDYMTSAWSIIDAKGKTIATIDLGDYGQPHCDYNWKCPEAQADAELLFSACPRLAPI